MNISNRIALVTGANRGIGFSLVEKLLEKGADSVYATYRSADNRTSLESLGDSVVPVPLDLGDSSTIKNLSDLVPYLDILINNAGIFTGFDLLDDTEQQLRNDIETNLFGTLAVTKSLLDRIKASSSGVIVNIASIAALGAMPGYGGYSASKAAMHSMTQSLRGSLKSDGIAVHGVYPGPVETRMTDGVDMQKTPASVVAENILRGIEQGSDEIFPDALAEQVGPLYLSSPKSLEETFSIF